VRPSTALALGLTLIGFGLAMLALGGDPRLQGAGIASICVGAGALIAGIAERWKQ
jgi:hypothetical protein